MKRMVLFFAVLLMAVPAMGETFVTITCVPDNNTVTVSYLVTGSDHLVRGFGLDITVEDANIIGMVPLDPNYRIYPGQIEIEDGEITDYNYPYEVDDLGDINLAVEMGSLYTMDANHESDANAGYGMKPGQSGVLFKFWVDKADENLYSYEITENAARGGIVLEDPCEEPNTISPLCQWHAAEPNFDFGDAPEPYPTLLPTGARHVDTGPKLGSLRDIEANGQPSANCDLDDTAGVDDEDGITNLVIKSDSGTVDVNVSAGCKLNAWIDFNNDGDWADAGEQIFTDQVLAGGTTNLPFNVPASAIKYTLLVSRWRVSTAGGDSYDGSAEDGEVEDYRGPEITLCHVPDVVGDPCDEAKAILIANGFAIGDITWAYSDTVPYKYVISTDPCYCNYIPCGSEVNMLLSDGSDCYLGMGDANIAQWTEVGRPTCWCYPRQCHGDADGLKSGSAAKGYIYVNTADLAIMSAGWLVKDPPKGSGILNQFVSGVPVACADFDHNKSGSASKGYIRVGTPDLTLMSAYWLVKEPNKGSGTPADCQPGNRTP